MGDDGGPVRELRGYGPLGEDIVVLVGGRYGWLGGGGYHGGWHWESQWNEARMMEEGGGVGNGMGDVDGGCSGVDVVDLEEGGGDGDGVGMSHGRKSGCWK